MTYPSRPVRRLPERKPGPVMPNLLNALVTLLAVFCVVGAVGGFWLYRSFQEALAPTPSEIASSYVQDLLDGNWVSAYAQTCAAARQSVTEQEYAAARQAEPKMITSDVVETKQHDDNGRQTATVTLRITDAGGAVRMYPLPLVMEDGEWRPCP